MSDRPASIRNQVSPEYRKACLDMALRVANLGDKPETILEMAKKFYAYIHEVEE